MVGMHLENQSSLGNMVHAHAPGSPAKRYYPPQKELGKSELVS